MLNMGARIVPSSFRQAQAHVLLCDEKPKHLKNSPLTCREMFNMVLNPLIAYERYLDGAPVDKDEMDTWWTHNVLHAARERAIFYDDCCWNHIFLAFVHK